MSVRFKFWVVCDSCGDEADCGDAESESDAIGYAKDQGWAVTANGDICPLCKNGPRI